MSYNTRISVSIRFGRQELRRLISVCRSLENRGTSLDAWLMRFFFLSVVLITDMLRQLDLHIPAAELNKYCSTQSLRTLTQVSFMVSHSLFMLQLTKTRYRTLSSFTLHVVDVGKESSKLPTISVKNAKFSSRLVVSGS